MHWKKYIGLIALALLMVGFTSGCMKSNAVKLTYPLGPVQTSCLGELVVFKFEDKRSTTRLGKYSDGATIDSLSDVADWVGWGLFEELKAAGCDPKYRTSTVTPGELPLISGEVLELSLNQTGTTTYKGKLSVRVVLERPGQPLHSEKFTSEVEDVVLPGYATESDLMAEVLRSLLAEAVPSFAKKI